MATVTVELLDKVIRDQGPVVVVLRLEDLIYLDGKSLRNGQQGWRCCEEEVRVELVNSGAWTKQVDGNRKCSAREVRLSKL